MNTGSPSEEARRNHARVVEDDEFVSGEKVGEFRKLRILEPAAHAVNDEQPGRVAAVKRTLGDQLLGKVVMKVVNTHKLQL